MQHAEETSHRKSINVPTYVQNLAGLLGKCRISDFYSLYDYRDMIFQLKVLFNSNFNFSIKFRSSYLLCRMQWQVV